MTTSRDPRGLRTSQRSRFLLLSSLSLVGRRSGGLVSGPSCLGEAVAEVLVLWGYGGGCLDFLCSKVGGTQCWCGLSHVWRLGAVFQLPPAEVSAPSHCLQEQGLR